ncbi:hypothetical protein D1B33_07570 [Lysinibacillus yapensis]|uniref:Uncharacterized protein n=1 Tax=Ureibacillus yapensis TaxID=2304605 RepID=A0A396SCB2_9BACL|nr:hypothetical protein [Lysinibacillus yapensis]RHW38723.1 hypothetical protein D1B33_07570 [Lysinibacillus yapensis]
MSTLEKNKIYAAYRGEEYLTDGTKEELAQYLGVKRTTIQFYMTPSWLKRTSERALRIVALDDE